jgi:hypothetical protein
MATAKSRSARSDDRHAGVEQGEQEYEATHKSTVPKVIRTSVSKAASRPSLKYSTKFVATSIIGKAPCSRKFIFVFLENLIGQGSVKTVNNHVHARCPRALF